MDNIKNEMATLDIIADKKESIGISTIYTLKRAETKSVFIDKQSIIEKINVNSLGIAYTDNQLTIIASSDKTLIIDNNLNKVMIELSGLTEYESCKKIDTFEVGDYIIYEIECENITLGYEDNSPYTIAIVFNNKDKAIERIIDNVEKIDCIEGINSVKIFYYTNNFEVGVIEYFYQDSSKNVSYTYSDDLVVFCELLYSN